jgi:hypothetical protein
MINYTWKIQELTVATSELGLQDVVKSVRYVVTASEDGISTDIELSVALNAIADPDQFVAFVDLTEQTVLGWIQPLTNMIQLEATAMMYLQELRKPPIVTKSLPWTLTTG